MGEMLAQCGLEEIRSGQPGKIPHSGKFERQQISKIKKKAKNFVTILTLPL